MPGVAFHAEVLKQVTDALLASDPPKGQVLDDQKSFAMLGAIGPDLFKYIPNDGSLLNTIETNGPHGLTNPESIEVVRNPLMVCYGMLFRLVVVPLWPLLDALHVFYEQMSNIAAAEETPVRPARMDPTSRG